MYVPKRSHLCERLANEFVHVGLNVVVTGSGTASPCADGADCAVGTALYTSKDAGILINIYETLDSYTIPGPALYGSGSSSNATSSANATVKATDADTATTTSAKVTAKTFCA